MNVKPVDTNVSFQYNNILKTLYLRGKIKPKYGLYGDRLTKDSVSLEHIICKSQGGKTETGNLALVTKKMNNIRGNKPINNYLTQENLARYIDYFLNVKLPEFDGVKYVRELLKSINKALEL